MTKNMKKLILSIAIALTRAVTFAQEVDDYNFNAWEHPIIKKLQAKSSEVIGYGVKDNDKWINIAILDKGTKVLYWINCTGFVIDKSKVSDIAYGKLIKRQLDPFDYHQILWETGLDLIDAAIYKFRFPKTIIQYANTNDYDKLVQEEFQLPSIKSAKTPLEKLAALYEERQIHLFNLARCKAKHPDKITTDTAFVRHIANTQKGIIKIGGNPDTTKIAEFYNSNCFSPIYKAVLKFQSAKLYFFTQDQIVFDSMNILAKNAQKLLNEKIDIFKLYQNLNVWRLTQMDSVAKQLANYQKQSNKPKNNVIQALLTSHDGNSKELWLSIFQAQKNFVTNLSVLNGINNYYIEQGVKYEISKINPLTIGVYQTSTGTIFTATMTTVERGNKLYELTDHRGNVMAVVSDKKKQVDINNDGIVDYYEADVVKATDYSSFGAPLPGRTFQIKQYDYDYNGKRKDNETGYIDYGNRMYDPNIGRFISVDGLTSKYPHFTPYQFSSNNPILNIDLDGLEGVDYTKNTVLFANGKPRFQSEDAKNTAMIPIRSFMINGTMTILHGDKQIEYNPSSAPSAVGIAINPGYYLALNIKAFSGKLLDYTMNQLVTNVNTATGIDKHSIIDGFANTFRHQAWQSLITMALGANTAKRSGDYHERDGIFSDKQKGEFAKDNVIDLVNNEYGRDYAKGFKFSEVTKDINSFTEYLNGLVQHLTSTVDGWKDDKSYDKLRNGETKLFDAKDKNVQKIFESAKNLDKITIE
jgi:RHS repeat-associated core domain